MAKGMFNALGEIAGGLVALGCYSGLAIDAYDTVMAGGVVRAGHATQVMVPMCMTPVGGFLPNAGKLLACPIAAGAVLGSTVTAPLAGWRIPRP